MYHLTDCPQFVTGEYYVALDPQRRFVPGLSPNTDPGLQSKPATEDLQSLRGQFR